MAEYESLSARSALCRVSKPFTTKFYDGHFALGAIGTLRSIVGCWHSVSLQFAASRLAVSMRIFTEIVFGREGRGCVLTLKMRFARRHSISSTSLSCSIFRNANCTTRKGSLNVWVATTLRVEVITGKEGPPSTNTNERRTSKENKVRV